MRMTSISASISRTYNLGNYESERVDVGLSAEIEMGEGLNKSMDLLTDLLAAYQKKIAVEVYARHPNAEPRNIAEIEHQIKTTHITRTRGAPPVESAVKVTVPAEGGRTETKRPPDPGQKVAIERWWHNLMKDDKARRYIREFVRQREKCRYSCLGDIPTLDEARAIWQTARAVMDAAQE